MLGKNFEERAWKTPAEEIAQLLAKSNLTEHDKERMKELQRRQRETQKLQESEDPHTRNPGQEGYF